MTWKGFVSRWRPVVLTRLGIPARTVYAWRDGSKEPPKGWQREAAEFWIEAKAGETEKKSEGQHAEEIMSNPHNPGNPFRRAEPLPPRKVTAEEAREQWSKTGGKLPPEGLAVPADLNVRKAGRIRKRSQ